jgi:hypothetical protein
MPLSYCARGMMRMPQRVGTMSTVTMEMMMKIREARKKI